VLRESHELGFQYKLANFGGLNIQANKKNFATKRKGKKTTPLEIIKVPEDVTMVDYEVTTSKQDFAKVHDGFERKQSSKHLDLLLDIH
jgi:hypothetical protein